jgi:YbgC/YbaW family acyl-CoA thioester hydrolase
MASFTCTLPVRFHDVDSAGIVFFARIFEYAHDAYEIWLRGIGYPLDPPFHERDYGLPLVHAEADFQAPIRLGQEVRVDLSLTSIGTSSFKVSSRLTGHDGVDLATVRTIHVCVDPKTGRPIPLPEAMRTAFVPYLA